MALHQEIVRDHYHKLREHLMLMDSLLSTSRRVTVFGCLEPGWAPDTLGAKISELHESCQKADLMIKLSKNLMASIKIKGKA